MCSCFCTNTVDSLPQYTVTTITTNDVLISSLRTEQTNELTEVTTVSEFNMTDKAEPFKPTEINKIIINFSLPTKMYKGDDYYSVKNVTSNKNVITKTEPVLIDSDTTTKPSTEGFDEYTTNNILIYSDEQVNGNKIGSTHPEMDSDKITRLTSSSSLGTIDSTTGINEYNELSTKVNKLTPKDESQLMSTVPSTTNENNNFAENPTQYYEPKTVEITTLNDRNSETTTFDSNTESTSMAITTNSEMLFNEFIVDNKYLNTENSTRLQDSFISTLNPTDSTTYPNDYVSSTIIKTYDNSDLSSIVESVPEYKKNIQTTMLLEDLSKTTSMSTIYMFSPPITSEDFQISTTNDLTNDLDVSTQNTIETHDLNFIKTTTLNILKNPITSNKNIEMTSTIFDNDNTHTSTDKNMLFNQDETTEAINAKTFEETISFDTTADILETTSSNLKSSTDQSMNRNPEITTESLNESIDFRTIYFDEENYINNAPVTTNLYAGISIKNNYNNIAKNPTEYSSFNTFEKTTIPTIFNDNTTFLTTTASDEFLITTSTIKNPDETTLVIPNNYTDPTRDDYLNEKNEITTKFNFITTTSVNLAKDSNRKSENDKTFTTKTSFDNEDVFIERTTALFDKENEFLYSTSKPVSLVTPVEGIQTHRIFDDRTSTFISKTLSDFDMTTYNYEDTKRTTLGTFALNKNIENDFKLHSVDTTLQPITNEGIEFTTLNDKFDENVATISVISTQSTEENIEKYSVISTDNIEVMTVTAPNQVTNDLINHPFNNSTKNDEMTTIVPELSTQSIESSIVPGSVSINDSNISQVIKKKWEALFDTTGSANNISSVDSDSKSTVVGIHFTVINGTEETVPNTEPTEAIVSKEIFTENYEVTDDSMNNAANGVEYNLTTTIRTRGKNESVITSTRVADRDDTISASEISTMANEVTTRSDFERKNESIVSTRTQGDQTDKTETSDCDPTTEPFAMFNSVNSFETTTNIISTITDSSATSGTFITTNTDSEYVNRDNLETTTVTIITMADWIKTKSTTLKSFNEIVTHKNVENRLHTPLEINIRKNVDSVITEIPLEPIAKTNDLDQIETTSLTSLSDASTMINVITTSIEVLVSNLSSENNQTTIENSIIAKPVTSTIYTDSYSSTTVRSINKSNSDTSLKQNEMSNVITKNKKINPFEFITTTEQFTVMPTEETKYNFQTNYPSTVDYKSELTSQDNVQDTTDLNDILTTTEYTITSKSIDIEDTTLKYTNHNQTNINNSYSVQKITTETRKWCWNDTDCDADHKCLAAKCLPTGESRVNNCPPGIITLQCLKGIIYS